MIAMRANGYTMRTFRREMDRRLGRSPRARRKPQPYVPPPRYAINLAEATVHELISCVRARLAEYDRRGVAPPHITLVAEQMLCEATGERSR